jgi:hypothetical protein
MVTLVIVNILRLGEADVNPASFNRQESGYGIHLSVYPSAWGRWSQGFLQFAEEFSILLVLQTKPYKRRDRLAHARVDRFGVLFHLMSETGI